MIKARYRMYYGLVISFAMIACTAATPGPVLTGNPQTLVSQLESDLDAARASQYDLLSPDWFDKAQSDYHKAKTALGKGARMSAIAESVAEARQSLKKAGEIAQISRTILADATAAREKALSVKADALGEPFLDVEHDYLKLSRAIENDNMRYAQNNTANVQAAYREVEIMAIKHNALKDVRQMMRDAKKDKAHKRVPIAYQSAEEALAAADDFIGKNPYAEEAIRQKAATAAFEARRVISLYSSRNAFDAMKPEEAALYLESMLVRLSKPMGQPDLRDQSVDDQVNTLIGLASRLNRDHESLQSQSRDDQTRIADLEKRLQGLAHLSRQHEEAKRILTVEQEFNDRFDKVHRSFRAHEAEVYKKGNQMVIRLRGIKFPVGQATLSPENYTLLTKVQQAIGFFGQPSVIVEGHTDSSGSDQTNKVLSQMRANAVKIYLVANNTLPSELIRAVGYGPERPLSSNATPEGRAANRRIDVVITPARTAR